MRIKTGATASASISLALGYHCSFCQEENLSAQTLVCTAHTASFLGIDLNKHIRLDTQKNLLTLLKNLNNRSDPSRFNNTNFTCACRHCGKREPWARMSYKTANFFSTVALCVLVITLTVVFFFIRNRHLSEIPPFLVWTAVTSGLIFAGITIYKKLDTKAKVKLIQQLPDSAIPVVYLHNTRTNKVIPLEEHI